MQQFLTSIKREVAIVNMDPANDILPYTSDIDIAELISLDDVMTNLKLGPNGGLVYCMEYLEQNLDWLKTKLEGLGDKYILFDFPGQVGGGGMYTWHFSVQTLIIRCLIDTLLHN